MIHASTEVERIIGGASGLILGVMTVGAVQAQDLDFLRFVGGGAVGLITILIAFRAFVRSEIAAHERSEQALDAARHGELLAHIQHLTQRLEDKGILPPTFVVVGGSSATPEPIPGRTSTT